MANILGKKQNANGDNVFAMSHSDIVKMRGGGALTDEHEKVVDASIAAEDKETTISLFVQNGYWTYENEQPVQNSHNDFRYCVVDVSKYDAISLNFYLAITYGAKCFFADDDGVKIGDFLANTTSGYVRFKKPVSATKLYFSTHYKTQNAYGAIGIKNDTALELIDKVNGLLGVVLTDKEENVVYPSSAVIGFIWDSGKWVAQSTRQLYMIPYEYQAGDRLSIKGGSNGSYYAFLTDVVTPVVGENVPFATDTKSFSLAPNGQEIIIDIPSNCGCIVIAKTNNASQPEQSIPSELKLIRKVASGGEHPVNIEDSRKTDFEICDENGNPIVTFQNGHIRTKEFNSENVESGLSISVLGTKLVIQNK